MLNPELREKEEKDEIRIEHETLMRGEPIDAMDFTLIYGLRSEKYRNESGRLSNKRNNNIVHKSHRADRVSLGKGNLHENAASLKEFGGHGNVIYVIDESVKNSKTFRPNSEHPNNAEFLIKGVSASAIKGIIVHNEDIERVTEKIEAIKKSLTDLSPEDVDVGKISFIESLPIISFEEQMEKEQLEK